MAISRWPHTLRTPKDPDATLDYQIDWGDWLVTGDSIVGSAWSVSGATIEDDTQFADTSATVWVSGGTVGMPIYLTNTITTSEGRIDQRTLVVQVAEK